MNRYFALTLCLVSAFGSMQSAEAFSISGPGGKQILAEPGSFYKGEPPKSKYDFNNSNEKTDEIGNPIPQPPPDPHRFDINMTKPITTQADVNAQAEKSCIVLGMSGSKHNNEDVVRAKCHTLNMQPIAELPTLHPLLDHSKDDEDTGKNYKPHVSMGKLHFSITHESTDSKLKSQKSVDNNIFKRHDDIDEENLPSSDSLKKADRSCDLTSDLRVMLSPRCLNSSEARARERIGSGDYHSINTDDVKRAVEIQRKNTDVNNDSGKRYLCHIDFNPKTKHGFVQGYLKSKEDCISAGMMMSGATKEEIFDQMGYLVGKHYNR